MCTLIGCLSGVSYQIPDEVSAAWPRPLTVEVCIRDHCESTEITSEQLVSPHRTRVGLPDGIDTNIQHPVSIEVRASDGSILLERSDTVTLKSFTPNGPGCPPTCWSATVVVDANP